MPAWLHILALFALVAVFGASAALLSTVIGRTSPWLVLLFMFYLLAIAKFAEPLVVLRMPRSLYQLRHWELESTLLRRLGVVGFGRLLRQTPLRYLNSRVYLDRRRDPHRVCVRAASAEASHFWAAVLFTPYIAFAAVGGKWHIVGWFSLAQVLVNVYPILHLRHIRGRLERTIRRIGVVQVRQGSPE